MFCWNSSTCRADVCMWCDELYKHLAESPVLWFVLVQNRVLSLDYSPEKVIRVLYFQSVCCVCTCARMCVCLCNSFPRSQLATKLATQANLTKWKSTLLCTVSWITFIHKYKESLWENLTNTTLTNMIQIPLESASRLSYCVPVIFGTGQVQILKMRM